MSSLTLCVGANLKVDALHRGWQRFIGFLFPSESDTWITVFRIGLGLQVTVYAVFLRSDWHYLFASSGKGLVGRELGEAISSFDSPLIPKFGWLIAVGRNLNMKYLLLIAAIVTLTSATTISSSDEGCCGGGACCPGACCMTMTR